MNLGLIRRHQKKPGWFKQFAFEERFAARIEKTKTCWLWRGAQNPANCGKKRWGYGTISFRGNRSFKAHRAAWILTFGEIPKGMQVCHKCDVPNCVNPKHLFLGTAKDNAQDMSRKGRRYRNFALNAYPHPGEESGTHKLKNKQVLEIRRLRKLSDPERRGGHVWSLRELAVKFDVSPRLIFFIVKRQTWTHI
jgi:HNH endonuclease